MKNLDNEFKTHAKVIQLITKRIESGNFDKDNMIKLMYMWSNCLQQEVDLFKHCTAILDQMAKNEEISKVVTT